MRATRKGSTAVWTILVLVATVACSRRDPVDWQSAGAALMRNLWRTSSVDVLCAEEIAGACELAAAESERQYGFDYRIDAGGRDPRANTARIVVGTYELPAARALLEHIGVHYGDLIQGRGFLWQEQVFVERADALIATLEDPERPGLPVTLYFGNDAQPLARYLGELAPAYRPWIRFYHAGELVLAGPLSAEGRVIPHRLDRLGARGYTIAINFAELPALVEGIRGGASRDIPSARLQSYLQRAGAARDRVLAWITPPAATPAARADIALSLYSEPEHLAVKGGNEGLAYVNPVSLAVHALCATDVPDDGGAAVAEAAAVVLAGAPAHAWMSEAAGVEAASTWWGRDLGTTAAWIDSGGRRPNVAELATSRASARRSQHVLVPMRAMLLRFLRESRGAGFVRQLWNGTIALPEGVDAEFAAWLAKLGAAHADDFAVRRARPSEPTAFAKGVGIEEPSRAPERGFGSQRYSQSLAQVRELGATSVLLASSLAAAHDPVEFAGLGAELAYGPIEGDLRLFAGVTRAKARGFEVLVAPSLLTAPGGSFRGSYVGPERADFEHVFERYACFLEHYGMVCELAGADWLSIGARIPELATPVDEGRRGRAETTEWKRAGWRTAIAAARGTFGGRLIYSASSLLELEKVELWKDVDAIGYALDTDVDRANPGGVFNARTLLLEELTRSLQSLEAFAASVDRPFVLTEVAFARRTTPARRTTAGFGSGETDLQLLAINVLTSMYLVRARTPHWKGLYLWRWSSDPDDAGASEHDPLLIGSSGLDMLRRAFHAP